MRPSSLSGSGAGNIGASICSLLQDIAPWDKKYTEIGRVIRAHTSARIFSYSRKRDGTIEVVTDDEHLHTVRRVHGKWEIEHSSPFIL